MGAILGIVGSIATLTAEYETADERRRAQIMAQLDAQHQTMKEALAGLPAKVAADDATADAAAALLPAAGTP